MAGRTSHSGEQGSLTGLVEVAVNVEFVDGVAVLQGARGPVHAHVATVTGGERHVVGGAVAGVFLEQAGPGAVRVVGDFDLVGGGVGGLPGDHDATDVRDLTQVEVDPLRVHALRARPARRGVTVEGVAGREGVVLHAQ